MFCRKVIEELHSLQMRQALQGMRLYVLWTSLTALAQFQPFIHIATFATGLRAWGEAVYLYEVHTVPTTLIFKQGERSEHMEYVEKIAMSYFPSFTKFDTTWPIFSL